MSGQGKEGKEEAERTQIELVLLAEGRLSRREEESRPADQDSGLVQSQRGMEKEG
jgi:hypothetical protein